MNLKSAKTGKIGKAFVTERLSRSLSLGEVAAETLINIDYIKAIESGDYSIFPARMFAVKYFEKYANFLGINIDFFDIYNAEVVAAHEADNQVQEDSFIEKNIKFFIFGSLILLIILIFFLIPSEDTELDLTESHSDYSEDIISNQAANLPYDYRHKLNEAYTQVNFLMNKSNINVTHGTNKLNESSIEIINE
jgi:transcriptional regulator with XRE-family HTH domain